MSKKWVAGMAAVLVLLVAAYLGSPFWAAREFRDAALSADVARLDAAVDFPAVRESLKSQMTVAVATQIQNDPEMRANPFAGLGMLMMPALIGKMVDSFVTPEGMSALIRRGRLEGGKAASKVNPDVTYDYDYRSLDRFAVSVRAPNMKDETPKFVFERRGLFSWKMVRLEVPEKAFGRPK